MSTGSPKHGRTLFMAATAAEAKAAIAQEGVPFDLRAWLTGQALVGMGNWTPLPEGAAMNDWHYDLRIADSLRLRAEWAVRQADAVIAALELPRERGDADGS